MSDDPLSSGLLGGDAGTGDDNVEELNFEHPLHASDAAARLGMSADAAALMGGTTAAPPAAPAPTSMMAASTPALGGQSAPSAGGAAAPAMNRQGSLFERIQAAQAAQGMPVSSSSVMTTGPTPAGGPAMTASTSNNLGQSQAEGGAVILEGSTTMGGGGGYDDNGPTLYASGPSIPQYQPEPSSGPYGGMMNDGLPEGASAGEKAMAVAGMAWEGIMRLGSKAARTGYRAVSQRGADGGGNQAGLLGGGGAAAAETMESGGAAPSYAPPGSEGAATMEGIGGGGNGAPQEGYSMVAYARQFVSDVAGMVATAPAPVQYALILLVCYLFWKIFA